MGKAEQATQWMINIANDSRHGYDQQYRWGERGDYDCSSLTIMSDELAGIPVKTNGATYTGNMYSAYRKCGYKDVTNAVNRRTGEGLKRGDVLLNVVHHVARYIGNGQLVQASINEFGKATGGQAGDQKQLKGLKGEINICSYYNYPWDYVLRYEEGTTTNANTNNSSSEGGKCSVNVTMPVLKKGMTGNAVGIWQQILCIAGHATGVDNSFGNDTEEKTIAFEKSVGIYDEPECVGSNAWKAGLSLLGARKTF